MRLHPPALGVVENQIGEIELDDVMQPRRQLFEKPIQLAVRCDRFRDIERVWY
jgi:hypothetical protein